MVNTRTLLAIGVITLISVFVRFFHLSEYPQSLSIDEVSFGYEANSILHTGRDENGEFLPLSFKALGDYKLPVQVYLTSLSIGLFGLNEFAIRFSVALFGSLTPLVLIAVLRQLNMTWAPSYLAGLWLAVSPWHVIYSRSTFEVVTALFLVHLGLLFYLLFRKYKHFVWLCISLTLFGLSVWTYNSMRVFVPLLLVFLFIYDFKRISRSIRTTPQRYVVPAIIIGILFGSLVVVALTNNDFLGRANDLWIGNDVYFNQKLADQDGGVIGQVVNNKFYLLTTEWVKQYLNYFDLRFLFSTGLNLTPTNKLGAGLISLADLPLILVGSYALIKLKNKFVKYLALFWALAAPIAASLTRGDPSSIRVLILITCVCFAMAAFWDMWATSRTKCKKLLLACYLIGFTVGTVHTYDIYLNGFRKYYADVWHYGYKEAISYVCDNYAKYDKVVVTDLYGRIGPNIKTVPYLYALIYCRVDPAHYLVDRAILNIEFRRLSWFDDSKLTNTLLVGSHWDFPEGFPSEWITKTIYFPSGEAALHIVETGPQKYYKNKY